MTNTIEKLMSFIKAAETSRKYLPNVASNHRTPLKLIDPELNVDEGESIDTFKSNLDQIFAVFYSKNQSKYSASSIEIYKRRVRTLLSDFENYGGDTSKMAAWNREIITRKRTKKESEGNKREVAFNQTEEEVVRSGESVSRFEMPLSKGKAIIIIPADSNLADIQIIEDYIGFIKKTKPGYNAGNNSQQEESQNNNDLNK